MIRSIEKYLNYQSAENERIINNSKTEKLYIAKYKSREKDSYIKICLNRRLSNNHSK